MLEQVFFDGVAVEPRDGAEPAGDGSSGAAAGFQIPGEALDVSAAGAEQLQVMLLAPAGVLAQVQFIGLAGQALYPARNPASASRSVFVNTGAIGTSAADGIVVVIGHLRGSG